MYQHRGNGSPKKERKKREGDEAYLNKYWPEASLIWWNTLLHTFKKLSKVIVGKFQRNLHQNLLKSNFQKPKRKKSFENSKSIMIYHIQRLLNNIEYFLLEDFMTSLPSHAG